MKARALAADFRFLPIVTDDTAEVENRQESPEKFPLCIALSSIINEPCTVYKKPAHMADDEVGVGMNVHDSRNNMSVD